MYIRTIKMGEDSHIKREIIVGLFKNRLVSIDTLYRKDFHTGRLIPRKKFYTITNENAPIADDKSVDYVIKNFDKNGKKLDIEV